MNGGSGIQLRAWYTTARWRATRKQQLQREPLCAFCKAKGYVEVATVCDHIEPHRGDPVKFWRGPFQSLCQTCHSSDKQRIESGSIPRSTFTHDGRVVWD